MLQGAVDRSDVYESVERSLQAFIAQNTSQMELAAREIRRAEVGETVAVEEEKQGRKPDEEYAEEAAQRQEERARLKKQEEAQRRRKEEKERTKLEMENKMRELEKLRNAEERRKEREAARASSKLDIETERRARQERVREELEREKDLERERWKMRDRDGSPGTPAAKMLNEKEIEEAALEALLQEVKKDKKEQEPPEPPHKQVVSIPKGPAADRNKFVQRLDLPSPRLAYSSTSTRRGINSPQLPAAPSRERSRSPYRKHTTPHEPSRDISSSHGHTSYQWTEDEIRSRDLEAKAAHKRKMTAERDAEAEVYKRAGADQDELARGSRSGTHDTAKDVERSRHHDYDYDRRRHPDERSETRDEDRGSRRSGPHYDDRSSSHYTERPSRDYYESRSERPVRIRTDEPPEHIDRYVPGLASSRDRPPRDRDADRGGRSSYRRDRGDRSSYDDRQREKDEDRDYYDKDRHRERDEYHRSKDKDTSSGYRERDRPRRDPAPERIDRYIPGGDRDRDRDKEKEKGRDRYREKEADGHKPRDVERDRGRKA